MKKIIALFLISFFISSCFLPTNKEGNLEGNKNLDVEQLCKDFINQKRNNLGFNIDNKNLENIKNILLALNYSEVNGEDNKFFRAFNSSKTCKEVFINDELTENLCEVIKNKNIDSYNYLKEYNDFDIGEKKEILGVSSKFLGNKEFKCDKKCKNSYEDFMILLNNSNNNNIELNDLFGMKTTEISLLIINGKFSKNEIKNFVVNKCIQSYIK